MSRRNQSLPFRSPKGPVCCTRWPRSKARNPKTTSATIGSLAPLRRRGYPVGDEPTSDGGRVTSLGRRVKGRHQWTTTSPTGRTVRTSPNSQGFTHPGRRRGARAAARQMGDDPASQQPSRRGHRGRGLLAAGVAGANCHDAVIADARETPKPAARDRVRRPVHRGDQPRRGSLRTARHGADRPRAGLPVDGHVTGVRVQPDRGRTSGPGAIGARRERPSAMTDLELPGAVALTGTARRGRPDSG